MPVTARLCRDRIDVAAALDGLYRTDCGAVNVFLGVVRDHHQGRAVQALQYEAYESMAVKQMQRIGEQIAAAHGLRVLHVVHRLGRMVPGETSLFVGVSSPHRKESLAATAAFVTTLKRDVPIWKKETFADGDSIWVEDCCSTPASTPPLPSVARIS